MNQKSAIDWTQVHQRLQAGEQGLREAIHPSEEAVQRVWEERARRLANRNGESAMVMDGVAILVFRLKTCRYGLELQYVKSATAMPCVTPVPGSAHQILGVIADHGEVRTVIEFARLLQVDGRDDPRQGILIHLRGIGGEAFLRVDGVDEIAHVSRASLESSQESVDRLPSGYYCGVQPDGLVLLNTKAILEACANPTLASEAQSQMEPPGVVEEGLLDSDKKDRETEP